ncbi:MAG: hypothetical protein FJ319_08850 [SAR202 cluster bacterium]|nr:hypothetical protein [SAR202 cluster bacterium]
MLPALLLYAFGLLCGALAGNFEAGAVQKWLVLYTAYTLVGSIALAALPRLALKMSPMVSQITGHTREPGGEGNAVLRKFSLPFWYGVALASFSVLPFALGPLPADTFSVYTNEIPLRVNMAVQSAVAAYFLMGVIAMSLVGLSLAARELRKQARLEDGFLLNGGKATLQPVKDLIVWSWLLAVLPLGIGSIFEYTFSGDSADSQRLYVVVGFIVFYLVIATSIFLPHLFLNRMLARQKASEMKSLKASLNACAEAPEGEEPTRAIHRLMRHQHLLHQMQQLQTITPTLIDARFLIQIGTSISIAVVTNILLKTILADILK